VVEVGRAYFVYMLASRINGTPYVGVTTTWFVGSTCIESIWFRGLRSATGMTSEV